MSFSSITVEERSKEAESLKSFLTYSLIGSLALHIGVLSSGIGNYFRRVPTAEDEPIDVTIIDSPTAKLEKPPEKIPIPEASKKEAEIVQKQSIEIPPVQKYIARLKTQRVQQPKQITQTQRVQQPKQTTQIQRVQQSKQITQIQRVQQSKQTTQNPQPTNREIAPKPKVSVTTVAPRGSNSGGSTVLTGNSGYGTALSSGLGISSRSDSRTGSRIGSGSGSRRTGSGISSRSGSHIVNETGNRPTVATAPIPPKINSSGNGNSNGNDNGRAACRQCNANYPEAARRQGVEGRVEVSVDTDKQGNVTNVRIAHSSGNRNLDEETLRQARDWKLKPADGGRKGVSIATEFVIRGSRRHRQVEERKTQRESEERTQQATVATSNSKERTLRRRRRKLIPPSNETTATKPAVSLPGIHPEGKATDSSQKPQATTNQPQLPPAAPSQQ
jgi:TonB family protein